jgi:putative hydrolase of the HAD superfamily
MINWHDLDTVFLDMDGTLLDLYFDNYFWQEYLPMHWGEIHGLDAETAKRELIPRFKSREGTLSWYCLDFWSGELNIDVLKLKADIEHLIQVRPSAQEFLESLLSRGKIPVMVTNAHEDLITMKLEKTGIGKYFREVVSSHRLGVPKEEAEFWHRLNKSVEFQPARTMLIDDNLTVLRTAREYGISNLFSIARPDSKAPVRDTEEFTAIHDFRDVL